MHKQGVVHRDIKLMNVFCCDSTDRPKVKIGDFGNSIKLEQGQMVTERVGTMAFAAPEILLEKPAGFKADVWSLGVLLYCLVSSNLPFSTT